MLMTSERGARQRQAVLVDQPARDRARRRRAGPPAASRCVLSSPLMIDRADQPAGLVGEDQLPGMVRLQAADLEGLVGERLHRLPTWRLRP